jgi:nucleoside-diphosphate-sugar epimerase
VICGDVYGSGIIRFRTIVSLGGDGKMAMKVFVAGGTGVLGRASVRALVEAGHRVRSSARGENKSDLVRSLGAEPVEVDLYDPAAVRRAIAGSDAVLRLTTKFGPMMKLRDPRTWTETMRLRTAGARILVDAAIAESVPVYVHESVSFVYADGGTAWLSEEAPTDDGDAALLRATLEGEQEATRFTEAGGTGIVLRFAGFYAADAASTLETITLARRRMMPQIGPASNYVASIYVPDAGRAVLAALGVPAGIYNVCDDEPVTFADYLHILTKAIGAPRPFRLPAILGKWMFGDIWKYFSRSQRVSNARLKELSNWKPTVRSVSEGWPLVADEIRSR